MYNSMLDNELDNVMLYYVDLCAFQPLKSPSSQVCACGCEDVQCLPGPGEIGG